MMNNLYKLRKHYPIRLFNSSKIETGITGLPADPSSRERLLKLYEQLRSEASGLPPSYAYRQGIVAMSEHRMGLLRDVRGRSAVDVEREIGGGQLEELVAQAQAELALLHKIKNEWKPWLEK